MKSLIESFKTAISMYSIIPVRFREWNDNNLKYIMNFFPFVGVFCSIGLILVYFLSSFSGFNNFLFGVLAVLINILITGGIHLDGFCDTADAVFSRRDKETKLKILKDPHCGPFAIFAIIMVILLQTASFSEIYSITDNSAIAIICFGYVISRILSAISVLYFEIAPTSSLVKTFGENSAPKSKIAIIAELIIVSVVFILFFRIKAIFMLAISALLFLYYFKMQKKSFGGTTGDIAGYFLVLCETIWIFSVNIAERIFI
jgi:adenosylcobinamide-GDP ribazoletransferase